MQVTFTREQYENIVKLAYLGEWMANSIRSEDTINEFDEILTYLLSFAKDAGHDAYVQYDEDMKQYIPSEKLEDELHDYVEDYNTETFWEELVHRLAERDMIKQFGAEAVQGMDFEERMDKEHPFLDTYYDEFEKKGIDTLEIKK
jgi:hypothetical protein